MIVDRRRYMSSTRFTANLLRSSASGFAGMVVSRVVDSSPEGGGAVVDFDAWKQHFQSIVLELAAAVEDGGRAQFAAKVAWERDAFAARGLKTDLLSLGLNELSNVLKGNLPNAAWTPLPEFFQAAVNELERDSVCHDVASSMSGPVGEIAAAYLEAIRKGDSKRAIDEVVKAIGDDRLSISDALDGVLALALRQIGMLWHSGEANVADEHFTTQATGRLLEQIMIVAPTPSPFGKTVVLAMAEGDAHDLGLRIVAAFFELDGWRTICLGANVPSADLALATQSFDPDLLVIGATLNTHREGATRAIATVRSSRNDQKILVGGPGFGGLEGRAQKIGADGCVIHAKDAPSLGRELVQG
ncbi:MAG: methanogenic corrinoid protein MtbC1 [Planctomycetota bacterium]|jgi:methanogenic corrinoid protein MtbC1